VRVVETSWTIKGREFVHCNCDPGCPCQFSSLPTHGDCKAVAAFHIDEGHHGETDLTGLNFGMIAAWPKAIHQGGGHVVPIIDERADDKQREALVRIMTGQDTIPGSTLFAVFATTFEKVHDPVFAPIHLDIDVDGRVAKLDVPGWIDAHGEPIKNPVTGVEQRARINLPNGFEYDVCEVGVGSASTSGPVDVQLANSHAQFAKIHMTENGVVH
jgi:hypothetical protein